MNIELLNKLSNFIELNPKKLGGTVVFKNTKISVTQIFYKLIDSDCLADICYVYDLDPIFITNFFEKLIQELFLNEQKTT